MFTQDWLLYLFGTEEDLNMLQMVDRAIVVAGYCLLLLRLSGRRAMALGTPMDNVHAILLGAILSRAVTGASPFIPTCAAAATITAIHRVLAYLGMKHRYVGRIVKGSAKIVYSQGSFNQKNMKYCRISMHDLMAGVRLAKGIDNLENVKTIYVERNGEISVIMKDETRG